MKSKFLILSIFLLILLSCLTELDPNQKGNHLPKQLNKMEIQYAYTILYVEDVPKTIDFYHTAFGFTKKFLTPEKDYGEVNSGITTLAFANIELGNANFQKGFQQSTVKEKPFGIELAFTTQNVEEVVENALKNGAIPLAETVTKPWGQKVGYLRDINGFIIEICTPILSE